MCTSTALLSSSFHSLFFFLPSLLHFIFFLSFSRFTFPLLPSAVALSEHSLLGTSVLGALPHTALRLCVRLSTVVGVSGVSFFHSVATFWSSFV